MHNALTRQRMQLQYQRSTVDMPFEPALSNCGRSAHNIARCRGV